MTLLKVQRVNQALVSIFFIGEDVWMLEKSILMVQKISHKERSYVALCLRTKDTSMQYATLIYSQGSLSLV